MSGKTSPEYQRAYREKNRKALSEKAKARYRALREAMTEAELEQKRALDRERYRRRQSRKQPLPKKPRRPARGESPEARAHRLAYYRRWRKQNAERVRLLNKAHKAKRRALEAAGQCSAADIKAQYDAQRGRCFYCRARVGRGRRSWHVDHVIPLIRGGRNSRDNIVIACARCNLNKNDKDPQDFAGILL